MSHQTLYQKWHKNISDLELQHRTCNKFSKEQQLPPLRQQKDGECGCGRWERLHSYEGKPNSEEVSEWNFATFTLPLEGIKTCGVLYNPYEQCLTKVKRMYFPFVDENFSFRLVYSL